MEMMQLIVHSAKQYSNDYGDQIICINLYKSVDLEEGNNEQRRFLRHSISIDYLMRKRNILPIGKNVNKSL